MANNGKHVGENKRMSNKERESDRECQCQASFRFEWETMRPGCVWMVWGHTCKHTRILQAQTHPPHWARACASETGLWVYWGDGEGAVPFCRANEACTHRHKGVERVSTALLHPFTHFLPLHSSWWGNAFSLKGIPRVMHLYACSALRQSDMSMRTLSHAWHCPGNWKGSYDRKQTQWSPSQEKNLLIINIVSLKCTVDIMFYFS